MGKVRSKVWDRFPYSASLDGSLGVKVISLSYRRKGISLMPLPLI